MLDKSYYRYVITTPGGVNAESAFTRMLLNARKPTPWVIQTTDAAEQFLSLSPDEFFIMHTLRLKILAYDSMSETGTHVTEDIKQYSELRKRYIKHGVTV